jgi:hypothetical protein
MANMFHPVRELLEPTEIKKYPILIYDIQLTSWKSRKSHF